MKSNKDSVEILAVNMDTQNDVAGFIKEKGITFPILLDEKNEVNKNFQILSIPTTFFIDENGIITHKFIGSMKARRHGKIHKMKTVKKTNQKRLVFFI